MAALSQQQGIDAIVVVSEVHLGKPIDLGHFDPKDASSDVAISTPATAKVTKILIGGEMPAEVNMIFGGGTVGSQTVTVGDEISPSFEKMMASEQLLIAGPWVDVATLGKAIEPWFVYALDANGNATSLLSGAGPNVYASFSMTDLEARLISLGR